MGKRHKNPELDEIITLAVSAGWSHEQLRNNHHRLRPPDTSTPMIVFGNTPSDHRAIRNLRATLRRRGLDI